MELDLEKLGVFLLYNSKVLEINHFHIRAVFYGTISLVKTGNIQRKISPLRSPFVSTGQALLCQSVILGTDFSIPSSHMIDSYVLFFVLTMVLACIVHYNGAFCIRERKTDERDFIKQLTPFLTLRSNIIFKR